MSKELKSYKVTGRLAKLDSIDGSTGFGIFAVLATDKKTKAKSVGMVAAPATSLQVGDIANLSKRNKKQKVEFNEEKLSYYSKSEKAVKK